LGASDKALAAEPPPEITTVRFEKDPTTCIAPQAFQELLRAEGFTDIRYVLATEAHLRRADAAKSGAVSDMIAHGEVDFGREFAPAHVMAMNAGAPITILSGLHLGCFEAFGILKAADLCVSEPERVAQLLVDQGYTKRYDYALQALSEIRYDVWRDYDPEDTLRFYALRLYEAGLIKSTPNKLIAEHTDWRFLNELKRELKA
jgi:hypothetical protein